MSEGSANVREGFPRRQLSYAVATHVRELIMSGNVRPGDFIRQDALADELQLSATPIREGLLLLSGRFVPLALTLLAGLIVNITLFNATLMPALIPAALVLGVLEIFLVWAYRESFAGIFNAKAVPRT